MLWKVARVCCRTIAVHFGLRCRATGSFSQAQSLSKSVLASQLLISEMRRKRVKLDSVTGAVLWSAFLRLLLPVGAIGGGGSVFLCFCFGVALLARFTHNRGSGPPSPRLLQGAMPSQCLEAF